MSDPIGLGTYKDCLLIYQYVAATNRWKYWPGIDAVLDDSDFTSCFDKRVCRISSHDLFPSSILKQPTIWFSFCHVVITTPWSDISIMHVEFRFMKVWILWFNKVKILIILLQRFCSKHDFHVLVYDYDSPVIKCKRYHTGTFSEPGYCLNRVLIY